MTEPHRVRLSRARGWRKPADTVVCSRPSRWSNPITMAMLRVEWPEATPRELRAMCVSDFRGHMAGRFEPDGYLDFPSIDDIRTHLVGKNLACWCPLDEPCHCDVLLAIANDWPGWEAHRGRPRES